MWRCKILSDIKKEIEHHFKNNWADTPIQYQGADFISSKRWIGLSFVPVDRSANTCGRRMSSSLLKVLCYDDNTTTVIDLADKVNAFTDCLELGLCRLSVGNPDGLGVQDMGNSTFELALIFEVNNTF